MPLLRLTLKAPSVICSRLQFNFFFFSKIINKVCYFMRIVCWQTILVKISYLTFCRKLGKMSQNLSSAAGVIGALMVKVKSKLHNESQHCELHMLRDFLCRLIFGFLI